MGTIIVDSCCDVTAEMKKDMDIVSIPLTMMLGDKEYCDDDSLNLETFMNDMKAFPSCPRSAAPPPILFQEATEKAGESFVVTLSKKLSTTYENAVMGISQAEENKNAKGHVFDSKSASAGETLIAIKIFELIKSGLPREKIIKTVTQFIDNMKTYFVLENYDNVQKNGRMSKVTGTIISILGIKVIAGADGNGEIAVFEKCRGSKNMIEKLLSLVDKGSQEKKGENIVITHCNNPGLAGQLKELIDKRFNFKNIYIVPTRGISSLYADNMGVVLAF